MSILDFVLLGFVALTALVGLRSGLVATALSLAGLVAGAALGGVRLAVAFLGDCRIKLGNGAKIFNTNLLDASAVGVFADRPAARIICGDACACLRWTTFARPSRC